MTLTDLRELQKIWNEFGEKDALWAALTEPEKQGGKWDVDEFFQVGQQEIEAVLRIVRDHLPDISTRRALDFGCGPGRLSQALASRFDEVYGVDIAPSMIDQAKKHNRHGEKCRYIVNEREDLQIFARGFFDFICSSITLQHIDPVYAKRYLKEFLRVLAPGGALVFNLPLRPSRLGDRFCYRFFRRRWYNREKKKVWPALIMEMHGISRRKVIKLITRAGGRILQIVNDPASGEKWISLKYFVQKPEYLLKIIPSKIPGSFRSGDMTTIALRIENRGSEALQPESADPNLKVGGKLFPDKPGIKEGAVKEYRAPLPLPLAPGESRDVEMGVEFFDVQKGKYVLLLDMVVEDKYWFNERSCAPLIKKVNIF